MELTHLSPELKIYKYGLKKRTLQKVYSVQTPVLRQDFFNRKTLIFSHCVVSEALDHTPGSQSHTHARMHTNTQAAKAEFNPTDYCYRRNQDIYLYVQSPIQINTNSTVTLTHFYHTHIQANTHPLTNTPGDNALQWGFQLPKAAKHL